MLQLRPDGSWQVPVLLTQGTDGTGVSEVIESVDAHAAALEARSPAELAGARVQEWYEILRDELALRLDRALDGDALAATAERLRRGETDPYSAAPDALSDPVALVRGLTDDDGTSE